MARVALALANPDNSPASDESEAERPQGTEALGLGVAATVEAALRGELSPSYIRKYYENKKLKPKHMKILRLAVAGWDSRQIARALDLTEARVSIILNHPDASAIMARIVGAAADKLGVSERLQAVAPEMLEHTLGVIRTTHNDALKLKGAFALLDRAGFTPTHKVEVNDQRSTAAAPAILQRLVDVMAESNALHAEAYDPSKRSLSAAAQAMSTMQGEVGQGEVASVKDELTVASVKDGLIVDSAEGVPVVVVEGTPETTPSAVSGGTTSREVPPGSESQQDRALAGSI